MFTDECVTNYKINFNHSRKKSAIEKKNIFQIKKKFKNRNKSFSFLHNQPANIDLFN